jgi:HK97 family phage major capsid protein
MKYIEQQMEARARVWEQAKALLDQAAEQKRDLTAEEKASYDKMNVELNERQAVIEQMRKDDAREQQLATATRDIVRPMVETPREVTDADQIRALARGEVRSLTFEKRDVLKSSTGSPVPTSFYDEVIMLARAAGPMLETSTVLTTASGENLQIPSLSAYSTATLTSEAASISESDPIFNAFVTLSAYKFAFLVQLSQELIEDSGVDILAFLAQQVGNELGFRANTALTTGSGSSQPNGIVTAAGSALTGTATGGAFTADNLISLVYSIDRAGRVLPGGGFQMNATALAAMRSLKDSAGYYVFSPALNAQAQDLLLGYPVYENPAMSSPAANTKSVIFGNLKSYYVRQVGGIRLDRSDDFAFANGLVTFRAQIRLDGNLIQTSHVKFFKGGTA